MCQEESETPTEHPQGLLAKSASQDSSSVPRPCPWCGPADDESETPVVSSDGRKLFVMCRLCGARGPEVHEDEYARDAYVIGIWNRMAACNCATSMPEGDLA